MSAERERKLNLSDPGRDAVGDEIELLLQDAEEAEDDAVGEDVGTDSFLERLPASFRKAAPAKS